MAGAGTAFAGAPYNDAGGSAAGRAYVLGLVSSSAVTSDEQSRAVLGLWPNPLPGNTTVLLRIPHAQEDGPLDRAVYDALGRRVASARWASSPGSPLAWRLQDATGRHLASGTYLLRLVQGHAAPASVLLTVVR